MKNKIKAKDKVILRTKNGDVEVVVCQEGEGFLGIIHEGRPCTILFDKVIIENTKTILLTQY